MGTFRRASESGKRLNRLTFSKNSRLLGNRQFKAVLDARRRASDHLLTLYVAPNECGHPRLGVSVGRACGNAVTRNRLKRLIREAFRLSQQHLPPAFDYVVMISGPLARKLKDPEKGKGVLVALTWRQLQESFLSLVDAATIRRE